MRRFAVSALALAVLLIAHTAAAQVEIPQGLKDIPLYEAAKPVMAFADQGAETIAVEVKAKPADVAAFYKKHLLDKGFKLIMEMNQEDASLVAFKKDGMVVSITIGEDGAGKTLYNIVKSKE